MGFCFIFFIIRVLLLLRGNWCTRTVVLRKKKLILKFPSFPWNIKLWTVCSPPEWIAHSSCSLSLVPPWVLTFYFPALMQRSLLTVHQPLPLVPCWGRHPSEASARVDHTGATAKDPNMPCQCHWRVMTGRADQKAEFIGWAVVVNPEISQEKGILKLKF